MTYALYNYQVKLVSGIQDLAKAVKCAPVFITQNIDRVNILNEETGVIVAIYYDCYKETISFKPNTAELVVLKGLGVTIEPEHLDELETIEAVEPESATTYTVVVEMADTTYIKKVVKSITEALSYVKAVMVSEPTCTQRVYRENDVVPALTVSYWAPKDVHAAHLRPVGCHEEVMALYNFVEENNLYL